MGRLLSQAWHAPSPALHPSLTNPYSQSLFIIPSYESDLPTFLNYLDQNMPETVHLGDVLQLTVHAWLKASKPGF